MNQVLREPVKTKDVGSGVSISGDGLHLLLEKPDNSHVFPRSPQTCKPHQFYHIGYIIFDDDDADRIGVSQCRQCGLVENIFIRGIQCPEIFKTRHAP